jgi:hypothetical protein
MLFKGTVIFYFENHIKNKNTLCGQNAEFQCVNAGDIHSNQLGYKCLVGGLFCPSDLQSLNSSTCDSVPKA